MKDLPLQRTYQFTVQLQDFADGPIQCIDSTVARSVLQDILDRGDKHASFTLNVVGETVEITEEDES